MIKSFVPLACFRLRFWVGFFLLLVVFYSVRLCFLRRYVFFPRALRVVVLLTWHCDSSVFPPVSVILSLPVRRFLWEILRMSSLLSENLDDGCVFKCCLEFVIVSCVYLIIFCIVHQDILTPGFLAVNCVCIYGKLYIYIFLCETRYVFNLYISSVGIGHSVIAFQSWNHWIIQIIFLSISSDILLAWGKAYPILHAGKILKELWYLHVKRLFSIDFVVWNQFRNVVHSPLLPA
jgi:hypothetical protein